MDRDLGSRVGHSVRNRKNNRNIKQVKKKKKFLVILICMTIKNNITILSNEY